MAATILGLLLAYRGYSTWRHQILGKTEHEVARNVLLAALKVREEIRQVRVLLQFFPRNYAYDPAEVIDSEMDDAERESKVHLASLGARRVELELVGLEAEALWGKEALWQIHVLTGHARSVEHAVDGYFMLRSLAAPSITLDQIPGASDVFKDALSGHDAFAAQVDAAVEHLQNFYRPKLQLRR